MVNSFLSITLSSASTCQSAFHLHLLRFLHSIGTGEKVSTLACISFGKAIITARKSFADRSANSFGSVEGRKNGDINCLEEEKVLS